MRCAHGDLSTSSALSCGPAPSSALCLSLALSLRRCPPTGSILSTVRSHSEQCDTLRTSQSQFIGLGPGSGLAGKCVRNKSLPALILRSRTHVRSFVQPAARDWKYLCTFSRDIFGTHEHTCERARTHTRPDYAHGDQAEDYIRACTQFIYTCGPHSYHIADIFISYTSTPRTRAHTHTCLDEMASVGFGRCE